MLGEWCLHVNVSVCVFFICFIIQDHDCDTLDEKKCKIYLFHIKILFPMLHSCPAMRMTIFMAGQQCNIWNRIVTPLSWLDNYVTLGIEMAEQLCNMWNRIVTILMAGQLCNIGNRIVTIYMAG